VIATDVRELRLEPQTTEDGAEPAVRGQIDLGPVGVDAQQNAQRPAPWPDEPKREPLVAQG
jgi:hypothetical protein